MVAILAFSSHAFYFAINIVFKHQVVFLP